MFVWDLTCCLAPFPALPTCTPNYTRAPLDLLDNLGKGVIQIRMPDMWTPAQKVKCYQQGVYYKYDLFSRIRDNDRPIILLSQYALGISTSSGVSFQFAFPKRLVNPTPSTIAMNHA